MRESRGGGEQSRYSQCLRRHGEHFSHENSPFSDAVILKKTCWYIQYGNNQNAVMISTITRVCLLCITHIYSDRRDILSPPCLCYSLPTRTMIRDIKPHLWMWSRTLFLITSKLLQWHDIMERKSPLRPQRCPLFEQLHHMGLLSLHRSLQGHICISYFTVKGRWRTQNEPEKSKDCYFNSETGVEGILL